VGATSSITIAVFVALYVIYTPLAAPMVDGVQGRYFIPVAHLLMAALAMRGRPVLRRWLVARGTRRVWIFAGATNALLLISLLGRYYAPVTWPFPY
jgi:Predicted membrane protein (DUF2142)